MIGKVGKLGQGKVPNDKRYSLIFTKNFLVFEIDYHVILVFLNFVEDNEQIAHSSYFDCSMIHLQHDE